MATNPILLLSAFEIAIGILIGILGHKKALARLQKGALTTLLVNTATGGATLEYRRPKRNWITFKKNKKEAAAILANGYVYPDESGNGARYSIIDTISGKAVRIMRELADEAFAPEIRRLDGWAHAAAINDRDIQNLRDGQSGITLKTLMIVLLIGMGITIAVCVSIYFLLKNKTAGG